MVVNAAKAFGAANIFAVDVNNLRLNIAKELGATHCINSAEVDSVKKLLELTSGVG